MDGAAHSFVTGADQVESCEDHQSGVGAAVESLHPLEVDAEGGHWCYSVEVGALLMMIHSVVVRLGLVE